MNFDKESKSEKFSLGQGKVVESGVAGVIIFRHDALS